MQVPDWLDFTDPTLFADLIIMHGKLDDKQSRPVIETTLLGIALMKGKDRDKLLANVRDARTTTIERGDEETSEPDAEPVANTATKAPKKKASNA